MRCSSVLALLCLVLMRCESENQGLFSRWRAWYHLKLKPCFKSCPSHAEFVCGYDSDRQRYAVASSRCALTRRNACYDEDYEEVPIDDCLARFKFHRDNNLLIPSKAESNHTKDLQTG